MTDDELKALAQQQATGGPQPGEIYRHYKGGLYVVVCRSIKEDTLEPLVTYRSNARATFCTRTVANFTDQVIPAGNLNAVPRFRRVLD